MFSSKINLLTIEKQSLMTENTSLMNHLKALEDKNELEKNEQKNLKNIESHRLINFSNEITKFLQNFNFFKV